MLNHTHHVPHTFQLSIRGWKMDKIRFNVGVPEVYNSRESLVLFPNFH